MNKKVISLLIIMMTASISASVFAYKTYFPELVGKYAKKPNQSEKIAVNNSKEIVTENGAIIDIQPSFDNAEQTENLNNNSQETELTLESTQEINSSPVNISSVTQENNKELSGEVKGEVTTTQSLPTPSPAPPRTVLCSGSFSYQLTCLINDYREEKGLNKLTSDTTLSAVALSHSNWMLTTGNFSHEGINGSRMFDRCATAGIRCLAENLAYNVKTAQEVLNLWKKNPGHNKNLLGPYSTAGIGISGKYLTLLLN